MGFNLIILCNAWTSGRVETSTGFSSRREVIVWGWSAELRMIRQMRLFASSPVRNCTSGKLSISWPGLYILDCPVRLIHHRELTSKRLDVSWSTIAHEDASIYHRDRTSGKLYISLSRIIHIRTPCTTIRIVHPEGFTSAHQGRDASGCLIRNALSSGWASGWLAFFILVVRKRAVQEGCATDALEAIE